MNRLSAHIGYLYTDLPMVDRLWGDGGAELAARDIPFAFTSGGGDILPPAHAHRRLVGKPFRISDIEAALAEFGG